MPVGMSLTGPENNQNLTKHTMETHNFVLIAVLNSLILKSHGEPEIPEPEFAPFNLAALRVLPKTEQGNPTSRKHYGDVSNALPA